MVKCCTNTGLTPLAANPRLIWSAAEALAVAGEEGLAEEEECAYLCSLVYTC